VAEDSQRSETSAPGKRALSLQRGLSASGLARSEMLWLLAILAVATALRFYKLESSLWYDEIDTLVNYVRPPFGELMTSYPSLNHHVMFSLEAKLSTLIFGESAWSLRLPAALLGLASIWAAWLVAREVVTRNEALFVAALLAVSYHHVWFSQNARGYTGLLFFGLLATYFLVRGLRKPTRGVWAAYGLAMAAAMYTHLSAAFFFAGHGLVWLWFFARARLRKSPAPIKGGDDAIGGFGPFIGFAAGGLLTLLMLAPLIPDMFETFTTVSGVGDDGRESVPEWRNPLWTVAEIGRSLVALGPLMAMGLPTALILIAIGVWDLFKSRPAVAALFVAHIPLTVLVLFVLSFRIWPRYFFIDAAFTLIFLVRGAYVLAGVAARELRRRKLLRIEDEAAALLMCAAMTVASLVLLPRNYAIPKQDFLGAAQYVEAARAPGDAAASVGLARLPFSLYYAPHWARAEAREDLERLVPADGRLWVVTAYSAHTRNMYPDIVDYLASDFDEVREFPGTLGDGYVHVYRSRTPEAERDP
jgi:hypothetical protein